MATRREAPEVDLARQRHAFYQILRSGAEHLVFTRAATVDDVPQNPSPFLEEVTKQLGRTGSNHESRATNHESRVTNHESSPWKIEDVVEAADCLSPRELQWVAGATLEPAVDHESRITNHESRITNSVHLSAVARGIEIVRARRSHDDWSRWEGRVHDDALLTALATRGRAHVWSASELEDFSACPWRGAVTRLLGLRAPEEEDEGRAHALERGLVIHAVLCDFLRQWRSETGRPRADVRADEFDRAWSLMQRVAERRLATRPEGALLWEIEREILLGGDRRRGVLKAFVEQEAADEGPLAPVLLEWRFGWSPDRPTPAMSEGQAPPLEIVEGGRTLCVRGVIDRIECTEDGESWAVVDYKTGRGDITATHLHQGLHLQLPLYAMAVAQTLADGGEVTGAIRRVGRLDQMGAKWILRSENCESRLRDARWHIGRIADAVSRGDFHWTTRRARDICDKCHWRQVCRRETTKAAAVGPPPPPPEESTEESAP